MKTSFIYLLSLWFLASCVIDTFVPVLNLSNDSNRRIRIYYSNDRNIDTAFLVEKYSVVYAGETHSSLKGDTLYNRKSYLDDTSKKLFLFIFDNDTINDLEGKENIERIAKKAFLERKEIDIRHITPKDTVFYREYKKEIEQ